MPALLNAVCDIVPWMQSRAAALDRDAAFPVEEIDGLRRAGALSPPLPVLCFAKTGELAAPLSLVGQANLSVGRILEAHVNALHLIARYGSVVGDDSPLYALWVTDPPTAGLRMRRAGNRISLTTGCGFPVSPVRGDRE